MAAEQGKSRRTFLKATSLTAGAAALGTLTTAQASAAERWDATADVVVLGYGGAGACAAIEAHDAGAKVIMLEKQPEGNLTPNTRMSGGMMHCPAHDADRAALKAYAKAMMSGDDIPGKLEGEDPELSDELAEVWAADTPGTIEFMKSLDPDFNPVRTGGPAFPNFPGAKASGYRVYFASYTGKTHDSPTRNLPKNQKINGEAFFAVLTVGVARRKIQVLYETPATELVIDRQRRVIGVVATRNGKPFRVRARRGVVVATGGYEYSVRMRRSFLEGPGVRGWAFWGTPFNTGDGIAMAMGVGARLDKVAKCAAGLICAGPSPVPGLMMGVGRLAIGSPHSFNVDNHGNRFADETLQSGDPSRYFFYKEAVMMDVRTLDYPRIPSWIIFDETFRTSYSLATQSMGPASQGLIDWSADNASAVKHGWIMQADTIEGLIPQIQAHPDNRKLLVPDNLIKAAARFNELCAKGKDEDFGRGARSLGAVDKPPFYASPLYAGGPNTKGGLAANAKRQVLDWNSKPIPRLYAAGEIASAFKFVYQGGGNLTECIVFGRIAGRNAAGEKAV